jgi:hypothetical protein
MREQERHRTRIACGLRYPQQKAKRKSNHEGTKSQRKARRVYVWAFDPVLYAAAAGIGG